MTDDLREKVAKTIADGVEWTDKRGFEFIKQLIQSGDIFLVERQNHAVVTENDYPKNPIVTFDRANLWCYEPFRGIKELEEKHKWKPIKEYIGGFENNYKTVLTIHKDDLHPVCAFLMNGEWLRVVEGPEDETNEPGGGYSKLVRPPTHFKEIVTPAGQGIVIS